MRWLEKLLKLIDTMRAVFFGTPDFAVPSLKRLLKSHHQVVGVITAPDKPSGRSLKIKAPPVKTVAKEHNLPILQPSDLKDAEFLSKLKTLQPDIGVIVAFRMLPEECFSIPTYGCINLHAALLPELRGAAPINWALINGYTRTGLTTFKIDSGMDTGLILMQKSVDIHPDENATQLEKRLSILGAELIIETLDGLESGDLRPIPQTGTPTRAPKITRHDCKIDWSKTAIQINNLIRGLSDEPGGFTFLGSKILKIFKSKVIDTSSQIDPPGSVVKSDKNGFHIATGSGILSLEEVQLADRKRMTASEFLRGNPVMVGTILK